MEGGPTSRRSPLQPFSCIRIIFNSQQPASSRSATAIAEALDRKAIIDRAHRGKASRRGPIWPSALGAMTRPDTFTTPGGLPACASIAPVPRSVNLGERSTQARFTPAASLDGRSAVRADRTNRPEKLFEIGINLEIEPVTSKSANRARGQADFDRSHPNEPSRVGYRLHLPFWRSSGAANATTHLDTRAPTRRLDRLRHSRSDDETREAVAAERQAVP